MNEEEDIVITPRAGEGPSCNSPAQWPPKINARWYSLKAPWSLKDPTPPEILHRGSVLRFCDSDNLKLEEAFLSRRDELERYWWEEEAAIQAGPKAAKQTHHQQTALNQSNAAPDFSPSWMDFMIPEQDEEIGVLVKSGTYEVDLQKRRMRPCFWPASQHTVIRATWFAEKSGEFVPLREPVADQLEQAFLCKIWVPQKGLLKPTSALTSPEKNALPIRAARLDLNAVVDVGLYALFLSEDEMYLMRDSSFSWLRRIGASTGTPTKLRLRRGYAPPASTAALQKEADLAAEALDDASAHRPPTHLVLVVHGIGQNLANANIANDAMQLRNNLRQLEKEYYVVGSTAESVKSDNKMDDGTAATAATGTSSMGAIDPLLGVLGSTSTSLTFAPPPHQEQQQEQQQKQHALDRIEVLPVQWRKTLSLEVDALAGALRPPGIPGLRQVLHSTAVEVLLYLTPLHRADVLGSLVTSLNSVYSRFMARNPNFRGTVSIVAHSLGSVLCWDILCNQPRFQNNSLHSSSTTRNNNNNNTINNMNTSSNTSSSAHMGPCTSSLSSPPEWSAAPVEISALHFQVDRLILAGSPLGCFLALRGIDQSKGRGLGTPASAPFMQCHPQCAVLPDGLPAVQRLYNLYHPYDPVAYRLEPLAYSPQQSGPKYRGALVELYGAGGKRLHIAAQEFGDNVTFAASRIGSTLAGALTFRARGEKGKDEDSNRTSTLDHAEGDGAKGVVGPTLVSTTTTTFDDVPQPQLQHSLDDSMMDVDLVDSVGRLQIPLPSQQQQQQQQYPSSSSSSSSSNIERVAGGLPSLDQTNASGYATSSQGRIDFALQEASLESQYIAALRAHFVYWSSMDVALFVQRAVKGLDVLTGK